MGNLIFQQATYNLMYVPEPTCTSPSQQPVFCRFCCWLQRTFNPRYKDPGLDAYINTRRQVAQVAQKANFRNLFFYLRPIDPTRTSPITRYIFQPHAQSFW